MFPLSPFEYALIVLAVARITRFVAVDAITEPVRDRLERASVDHADTAAGRVYGFVSDLAVCAYCAGFWLSVAVTWATVLAAGRWHAVHLWGILLLPWAVAFPAAILVTLDMKLTDK